MKFESHWPKGLGESIYHLKQTIYVFLFLALAAIFIGATVLAIVVQGHLSNIPMKVE